MVAWQWFTIIFGWVSVALFVALAARKIYLYATMPLNLRWEVYPVPHERSDRRGYGGSYMEQADWAAQPPPAGRGAELVEMASEIFLLKRVREHNPYGLWPLSMALHWGIYLLFFWIALLAVANWLPALMWPAIVIGGIALVLGAGGAVGLIVRRATQPALKHYTAPIDYFNLAFLAAIFGLGLASWIIDPLFSQHQAYLGSVLTFQPTPIAPLVLAMFLLLEGFAIYMPFSKLLHYIMKHFTFSETLWDDDFRRKGSRVDRRVARQLAYRADWGGPHIGPGKTWQEEVQETGADEEAGR
jgi:nitrate reductase gamma subunit